MSMELGVSSSEQHQSEIPQQKQANEVNKIFQNLGNKISKLIEHAIKPIIDPASKLKSLNLRSIALTNIDTMVVSIPLIFSAILGGAFKFIEAKNNTFCKSVGWLGSRCCIVLSLAASIPSLIYSIAKVCFLKISLLATLNKVKCLRRFTENSELGLKITFMTIGLVPYGILFVPPVVIFGCKTVKNIKND